MDWNGLKVFLSIARHGSLSAAAKDLDVNHTTIFRRIKAYEEEVGGPLFERINNRYELTTLGHELLDLAQNIDNTFDSINRHIVGKDFQPKGVVKITAPNNIAYRYLPRYIAEFNQHYPDIQIELLVSNHAFNMNNRQADIAVRATNTPPEHLIGRQVSRLNWGVFGSDDYEEQYGIPKTLDDLNQHIFIGATGAMRQLPAFVWLEKQLANRVVSRSDDLTAMSYFAQAGQGLAILPADQDRTEIKQLLILDDIPPSHLWLLTHPDLRNVERIKLVMQHLTNAFSKEWCTG